VSTGVSCGQAAKLAPFGPFDFGEPITFNHICDLQAAKNRLGGVDPKITRDLLRMVVREYRDIAGHRTTGVGEAIDEAKEILRDAGAITPEQMHLLPLIEAHRVRYANQPRAVGVPIRFFDSPDQASNAPFPEYRHLPIVIYRDGFRAERILDAQRLAEEGQMMHHCCGGYAYQCAVGTAVFYHIERSTDGSPDKWTLAINPRDGKIVDFRGVCNAEPPIEAWSWALYHLDAIGRGNVGLCADVMADAASKQWKPTFDQMPLVPIGIAGS
jgi:hypothetical protein